MQATARFPKCPTVIMRVASDTRPAQMLPLLLAMAASMQLDESVKGRNPSAEHKWWDTSSAVVGALDDDLVLNNDVVFTADIIVSTPLRLVIQFSAHTLTQLTPLLRCGVCRSVCDRQPRVHPPGVFIELASRPEGLTWTANLTLHDFSKGLGLEIMHAMIEGYKLPEFGLLCNGTGTVKMQARQATDGSVIRCTRLQHTGFERSSESELVILPQDGVTLAGGRSWNTWLPIEGMVAVPQGKLTIDPWLKRVGKVGRVSVPLAIYKLEDFIPFYGQARMHAGTQARGRFWQHNHTALAFTVCAHARMHPKNSRRLVQHELGLKCLGLDWVTFH